ncbi:WxL domain-containing protein [Enterococcus faecalis]|uniref:WxL domain-containing protein n=2 Tax=Enterococcus faecalis TaxID=1351 RepID=UPI00100F478D|nr:WxL domain-containing protein [Enterococcus faecalis]RXV44358.1 WxL domain-containing protein [Enterococcus faecalis]
MKQTKWQRLATIGLCSSLVMNAFSGVTAVAETVTIESSPTAESSAKEETQASSVKEETTKASRENSQETTDTSQEEATEEAEKQAETEVKEEQKEEPQAEVEQAEPPANSSENDLQKSISPRWVPNNQSIYPRMIFNFTDETGKAFADENLTLSGTYYKLARHIETKQWRAYADRYPIVSSNAGGGQYRVAVNAAISVPYDFLTNVPAGYDVNIYAIEQLKIDNTLKYVDSIVTQTNTISMTRYSNQQVSETPQFGNYTNNILTQRDRIFSKNSASIFSLNSVAFTTNVLDVVTIMRTDGIRTNSGMDLLLLGFDGTPTYRETLNYKVTRKQVTEKFVDANGVAITPPTGFTQSKKTPMTSNAFTFKQAGTLPDTYTTGGKTYKFKGWYKGKTKPSTLTATKAPSYAVTYDGNDDLNVVYEEVVTKTYTLPSKEITFGYVDEKGNLINPANFTLKATMSETTKSGTTTPFSTITGTNVTTTNLKKLTIPQKVYTLPESVEGTTYGTQSVTHEIPKYYRTISISPTATYTGDKTKYPLANEVRKDIENPSTVVSSSPGTNAYELGKTSNTSYNTKQYYWTWDTTKTLYAMGVYSGNVGATYNLATPDKTVYYYLENRRVTENFVDTSGAKITPPTGFTQGKKTVITSDAYTFKQAGTLPDTYTTGGKTYKFKGWYKGKSILNTLTTTKAPSYQVTYDDNDDLNVVYEEETVTTFYPSINLNFVNEKGGAFTPALTFSGKYNVQRASDNVITNLYDVTSKSKGNGQYTVSVNNGSIPLSQELFKKYTNGNPPIGSNALSFKLDKLAIDQQLKYVDSIQVEAVQSSGLNVYRYEYALGSSTIIDSSVAPMASNLPTADINGLSFNKNGTNFSNTTYRFLGMSIGSSMSSTGKYLFHTNLFSNNPTNDAKLVYKVTRKQVTENFVDANGAKITAPTGFTQGNQVPMNSNTFKYTAAKALPATYTTGGKVYTFQGWYKGKTKPSTLNKTTTPTFNATFDGNDDMTAMYKEEIPTASVTLTRPKEVIDTNTNVIWTTTITNTSKAPLQNLTLKKGPNWSAGLTIPTFMEVTPEGETTKSIPVNSTLWTDGVSLPNAVPIGKKVSVAFTTRATGKPNTVLKAEVVVFGGIKDSTVDNFVRIRPNDQEVVTPTTEGFISVPTFDFGQVGVAGSKQQHSLKQAADYYGNGTRNPYLRIKKTQPNWSLTAQLSQPKSATDSLPTATRLLLGAAPVSSFTNYNQPTELKNAVGTTSAISLTANNTATSIIANKQFTGSNVYQLDFTFNNVKLEVPANQGVKGQQYKAAVTWNLVTGP